MTSEKMTIEIPIAFLDYKMKNMPEIKARGQLRDTDVMTWMNKPENSAVITVMVIRKILQECIEMGFVIYDPEKKTWRGVDYHGD